MSSSSELIWKKRETFRFIEIWLRFSIEDFWWMYPFLPQTYLFWDLSFNVVILLLGLTTSNYALFSLHPHPLSFDFYEPLLAFFSISKSTWYNLWNNLLTQLPTFQFSSVQSFSCVWLFVTPWTAAHQASLSITSSQSLLKLTCIELMMPSNQLIHCCPLLLLPSIFPSIRVSSNESVLGIRWPKYWSFSFNISLSNEYSGLISYRMDWLDLLAVQGTLKSLLQHDSSKASILWHSAFFIVELSHPYKTTGKTILWLDWLLSAK